MADYSLEQPFFGELDGLTPREIFVLGYELSKVNQKLKGDSAFESLVHAENQQRMESFAGHHRQDAFFTWIPCDFSDSW